MVLRETLVIGALLHDIGKFEFRTEDRRQAHTSYGDFFVSEYLGRFQCMQPILEEVRRLVAHHHEAELANPFLRDADHLAAADRIVDGSPQTLRSLVSVLASINIGRGKIPQGVYRYVPGALDFENPFPEHLPGFTPANWVPDREKALTEHHRAWDGFCEDIRLIPDKDLKGWTETFLALAKKHLSRVASAAYKSHPDISLYDHARSVAAIAVCLQEAHQEKEPFALIQGDISGIQRFIYKLASPREEGGTKNMAKRLRGRSFYLALLSETVALYYLRKLELPPPNLLFSGGGHFTILAPNTPAAGQRWGEAEQRINHWLLDKHQGNLALVSTVTLADRNLLLDFPRLMQRSGEALNRTKRQKFRSVLDEGLFAPRAFAERMDVCPVCQADFISGEPTCPACRDHVKIGQQAVQAEYLVRAEGGDPGEESIGGFEELGFHWYLKADWRNTSHLVDTFREVTHVHLERLNSSEFISQEAQALAQRQAFPVSLGFRPLGQYAPRDKEEGGPLDFEGLAQKGSANYPLLGVVRMDVDWLGSVFATGMGEQRSLSRVATLSRELETFFSGYVNKLAKDHDIYVTYAGGDDLFVVGSWINALKFGQALRHDFARFACGNPNLTLSGGVLFCKHDFPIGRAAEVAGELEGRAKNVEAKDSVCLFGEVVSWSRLKALVEFGDTLFDLIREKSAEEHVPRSFVHRLLALGSRLKESERDGDMRAEMEVRMRLKYLVARRGATSRAISATEELEEGRRRIGALGRLVTEPELMQQIAIPVSYVLYRTRNLKEEGRENRHE